MRERTSKQTDVNKPSKVPHNLQANGKQFGVHLLLRTIVALTQKEIPRRDEKREPFSCESSLKPKNPAKWFCMERRDEMHLLTAYEILG